MDRATKISSANDLCEKAENYEKIGNYEEAIKCYTKALKLNPNHPHAWHFKAKSLIELGRFEEAIECLHQVLKQYPDYTQARELIKDSEDKLVELGKPYKRYEPEKDPHKDVVRFEITPQFSEPKEKSNKSKFFENLFGSRNAGEPEVKLIIEKIRYLKGPIVGTNLDIWINDSSFISNPDKRPQLVEGVCSLAISEGWEKETIDDAVFMISQGTYRVNIEFSGVGRDAVRHGNDRLQCFYRVTCFHYKPTNSSP